MNTRFFIISLMLLLPFAVHAQDQHVIDSLKSLIEDAKHDTSVCNAYLSWGEEVYLNNPDTALILWQNAHDLAERNLVSGPSPALEKKYLSSLAEALNNIGYIYMNQGDIPNALEFYHKSLKIQEEIGDKSGIATSLNNIGLVYKDQGDITKALEFYHKCLKIREEFGDKSGIARSLGNIAQLMVEQRDQESFSEAKEYATRSLKLAHEIGSPDHIEHGARVLSSIAKKQGDFQKALEMYELHILMRDSINNEETQKATIRQQTKYEFEKAQLVKEQEEKEAARVEAEVMSRRDNLQYSKLLRCTLREILRHCVMSG